MQLGDEFGRIEEEREPAYPCARREGYKRCDYIWSDLQELDYALRGELELGVEF